MWTRPLVYFWIGKRDRKNWCDVIFAMRLKGEKEERKTRQKERGRKICRIKIA